MKSWYIPYSLKRQAYFSFVAIFRESPQYERKYCLPFNMIGICVRESEEELSYMQNLETGEICFFHKNDVSMITCDVSARYHYELPEEHLCIHFKLELFPGADIFAGLRRQFFFNSPELRTEAEKIFAEKDSLLMLSKCQEFALHLCHLYWPKQYALDLTLIKPFENVLQYIRDNADASLGIGELAGKMNRSEGYFTRSFHEAFHQSPKQYLQKEVFTRSAKLLLDPKRNVKTVAEELNFSSEFYFSRFFKRLSGISPQEYRKQHCPFSGNIRK